MWFESSKNLICRTFKISVNQLLPQWSNRTHRKSNWETCSSQYENCDPSIAVSLTGKFSVQNLWAPLSIAVKHICFLNYCDFVQRAYNLVSCQALQGLAGLNTTSETQFYAHKIYIFFFLVGGGRLLFHTADFRKDLSCLEMLLISVAYMQNCDQTGILLQVIRTQT